MHHFPGPNVLNSVEEIPRGIFFYLSFIREHHKLQPTYFTLW